MADGILAAVNENGNIDRFIDTKGGVHYIEPKRYEESVAKIDAAATKAKETVNSATEAVSECKAQTGACTQETARAKEIADTVESRITGIEGDVAALRDSISYTVRTITFSANKQLGSLYYGEFDTEIKARNFVLAFPLAGVRFIRPSKQSTTNKQRWMIAQTYSGNNESVDVMFCCF